MNNLETARKILKTRHDRSAWNKGVTLYALDLLDSIKDPESITPDLTRTEFKKLVLNGARDWSQYSYGGCSLVYNGNIAKRLCSPSIIKRTRGGEYNPNNHETWLDVQARALGKAYARAYEAIFFGNAD